MVFPGRQQRQSRASQGATSGDTAGYCNRWYRVVHEGIHRESRAGHNADNRGWSPACGNRYRP